MVGSNKTMNDHKITIARSYGRKLSDGNYGSVDFFSSHSIDLPADTSAEMQSQASESLFNLAKLEVENAINEHLANYKTDSEKKV